MRHLYRIGSRALTAPHHVIGLVALLVAGVAAQAAAADPVTFDIAPQAMGPALRAFAEQAKVQVFYGDDVVAGVTSGGLHGAYEIEPGLKELLKGTGLAYERTDASTYVIVRQPGQSAEGPAGRFAEDVVVTASRREESVRETAATVNVAEGSDLAATGAATLDEYARDVVGMNYVDNAAQRDTVTMRGVAVSMATNLSQAPVGVYFNEIPLTDYFAYFGNFDVTPFDLERVEFLKGPQGTLYGSASLGGAIRYIAARPSFTKAEGTLNLTVSSTTDGGVNYLTQGMFNTPLAGGKLALRGVVSYQDDSGWIDSDIQGKDWNHYEQTSARLMAAWAPSDRVRIDLTYMRQDTDLNVGFNQVASPDFDAPSAADAFAGAPGTFEQQIGNLTLEWDAGFADLLSSTSYLKKDQVMDTFYGPAGVYDDLAMQEYLLANVVGLPVAPGELTGQLSESRSLIDPVFNETLLQELRLVSKDTGRLDWLAGIFYSDVEAGFTQAASFPGIEDAVNGIVPGVGSLLYPNDSWLVAKQDWTAQETALYGEVGIDLSSAWKLNVGGRYTDYESTAPISVSLYGQPAGHADVEPFSMSVFLPKASLRWSAPERGLLWYGLASRGYRAGGVNSTYLALSPAPIEEFTYFDTDNLWNYETGIRRAWADGRVTTDLSLYYLDWSDIQLEANFVVPQAPGGVINGVFNTSEAHSLGAELSYAASFASGFALAGAVAWNEAELDAATPPIIDLSSGQVVSVPAGARLPSSPEWSTTTTLQYYWDAPGLGYPHLALSHQYKDGYVTYLPSQSTVPSHSLVDLKAGATFASGIQLSLNVYNLLDERAATDFYPAQPGTFVPLRYPERWLITRPRTISVTVQKTF